MHNAPAAAPFMQAKGIFKDMPDDKDRFKNAKQVIDSIADGVFTISPDWRITSFNRAAEDITGISRDEAIGRTCREVLKASCCETDCPLKEAMRTGRPVVNKVVSIIDAEGFMRSISISAASISDQDGKVSGGVETFRDAGSVEKMREDLGKEYSCQDILSVNHEMRKIFEILPAVAESTSTVLIEGDTGTGKELFAHAIHNMSPRRAGPFVAVNCGALPDTLLESELFGYKAGAFTDAKRDKPGRFALAKGGTIFLDEIGDISPALQVRLLRVLQEKTYEPLGGINQVKADVRVIAATNKNLAELVKDGRFRSDLYYRLNIVRLAIPPLKDRREDIPLLAEHFIDHFNAVQNKRIKGLSPVAMKALMKHDFPGNVRELENIIERAFILCRSGHIDSQHLPELLDNDIDYEMGDKGPAGSLKRMEAAFLMSALKRNNYNRLQTAKELGMHKSTLFRKIKSLGLKVPLSEKGNPKQ